MKNLKVARKLMVGFGVVIILFLIASLTSIFSMKAMSVQISKYTQYTVPNTNMTWQMRRDIISLQRYLLMAMAEDDQGMLENSLSVVEEEVEQISSVLQEYVKNTRADKATVQKFQTNFEAMKPIIQQMSSLLRKNTDEANVQAYAVFKKDFKPVLDESAQLLLEISDFQMKLSEQQKIESEKVSQLGMIVLIVIAIVSILITIAVVILITKSILKPVKEIQEASRSIANGDLDVQITYDGKDELGDLAENMRETTFTLRAVIGDINMLLGAMAEGDFTKRSTCREKYVGQFQSLLMSLQNIIFSLTDTLTHINQSSHQVASGSDQVASGAQALSQGATEQASSIEELSAAINEISDKVRKNAGNVENARQETKHASDEMEISNQKMQEMIGAMDVINDKSAEISKIIKTIEDIAFQTNILALNAAVEAARAGVAGKGFAVVADEVRNLAQKSSEAAKNTTTLIEETVSAVKVGSKIVDETAKSMLVVINDTAMVTGIVDEIAVASNEQASSIIQITEGIDQISNVIQTNSATAEESAAASEELSGQAEMLMQLCSEFKLSDSTPGMGVQGSSEEHFNATPVSTDFTPSGYDVMDKY